MFTWCYVYHIKNSQGIETDHWTIISCISVTWVSALSRPFRRLHAVLNLFIQMGEMNMITDYDQFFHAIVTKIHIGPILHKTLGWPGIPKNSGHFSLTEILHLIGWQPKKVQALSLCALDIYNLFFHFLHSEWYDLFIRRNFIFKFNFTWLITLKKYIMFCHFTGQTGNIKKNGFRRVKKL